MTYLYGLLLLFWTPEVDTNDTTQKVVRGEDYITKVVGFITIPLLLFYVLDLLGSHFYEDNTIVHIETLKPDCFPDPLFLLVFYTTNHCTKPSYERVKSYKGLWDRTFSLFLTPTQDREGEISKWGTLLMDGGDWRFTLNVIIHGVFRKHF